MAETTKAQLQTLLDEANAKIAALEAQIASFNADEALKAANDKIATLEAAVSSITAQLSTAMDEITAYETANAALTLQVEELSAQVTDAPATTTLSAKTFKHGDDTYTFAIPGLNHKDRGVITADHVLADEALQDELVKMGSGMIKKV